VEPCPLEEEDSEMVVREAAFPGKSSPVLPPPQCCPQCRGSGWLGYDPDSGGSIECSLCFGWGQYTEPEAVCPACFVAASGCDEIDVGLHLGSFIKQLVVDWPNLESDVLIWECTAGEPSRWKAVAILSPGPRGTEVRHL
jgi:hypothetical protein